MPTTINGDDATVPRFLYLTGLGVGQRLIAIGANNEVIAVNVSIQAAELLANVAVQPAPDSLVLRDSSGNGQFNTVIVHVVTGFNDGDNVTITAKDGNLGGGKGGRLDLFGGSGQGDGAGDGGDVRIIAGAGGTNGGNVIISSGSGSLPGNIQINAPTGVVLTGDLSISGTTYVAAFNLGPGAADGKFLISDSIGNGSWNSAAIRIKSSKLQMKNLDDNLYYDVVLRTVSGVPTLSVEGSGES